MRNRKRTRFDNERAGRARRLLEVQMGMTLEADAKTSVTDILSDLMHFCGIEGIDFEARLDVARQHFEAERGRK